MPSQKNFKRLVRGRMADTGESYTAARSRFAPPTVAATPRDHDPDMAVLARALSAAGYLNPVDGRPLTDDLLFGVAGGIGFGYLVFVHPGWISVNVDGRFNALYFDKRGFIEAACARLGVPVRVRPTGDAQATGRYLRQALATAPAVALVVDLARLPGATSSRPWCPCPVTVAEDGARLTVTGLPRGQVTMGWPELIEARWTHARKYGGVYRFGTPATPIEVRSALLAGINRTVDCLLEPSRSRFDSDFGVPGIRKWARLLTDPRDRKGWPRLCEQPEVRRAALASVVEGLGGPGGTGSAARRRYAAFLDEAATLLDAPELAAVADTYRDLADGWATLVRLAGQPDTTGVDLAALVPDLADTEETAALSLRQALAGHAGEDRS